MGVPHDPPDAAARERWLLQLALAAGEPGVTGMPPREQRRHHAAEYVENLPLQLLTRPLIHPNGLVVRAPSCRAAHADRNAANTFALVVASASTASPSSAAVRPFGQLSIQRPIATHVPLGCPRSPRGPAAGGSRTSHAFSRAPHEFMPVLSDNS